MSRNLTITVTAGALVAALNAAPGLLASQPTADPADPAAQALQDDIDAILADSRLDGGQASVTVLDAETGEELYSRDSDTRLMPASNNKLLTSAVAMDLLGPDHTFETTVETSGRTTGPVLHGDLYLRGRGDPTMLAEDYAELAGQLADSGVDVVIGDLVADDTYFDDVRLGNDWNWDDFPFYYAAQISALSVGPNTDYDAGTVIVRVEPGESQGDPAVVTLTPDNDYVEVVNEAATTEAGSGRSISIERPHGQNRLVISGTIATDAFPRSVWRSVWEPTNLAADVFAKALDDAGVKVVGTTTTGAAPDGTDVIASHSSMPLSQMLTPFMKLSNNGHAEVLVKTIGAELGSGGTWSAGLSVLRDHVRSEYGLDTSTFTTRDGSGLSRRNWIPSAELITLLDAVQVEPWFDTWYEALPIAGVSERFVGGTLRNRMQGTPAEDNAHAKTGTLTGATGLSGYVDDADGDRLIFSILLNNYLSGKPSDIEDAIVVRLAEFSESGDSAAPLRTRSVPPSSRDLPDDVECSWIKDENGDAC